MAVYKSKTPTKDGRQYFFRIKYKDIFGVTHDYSSPKFKSFKEATNEEAIFRVKVNNQKAYVSNITLEQAYYELRNHKTNNIKKQTIRKDDDLYKHLSILSNKKINDIDMVSYNALIKDLNTKNISATYKNKILGLFKQIIRYSAKYRNTSGSILQYVENFKEVGLIKKEMDFFTYEEYKKFDSVIDEFSWHVFFSILYFMGLRQGEAQALTWEDIDLKKQEIRINKTLTTKIKGEKWTISSPKTKSSIRTLPLRKKLTDDLKMLKSEAEKYKDFSNKWFVFENSVPFKETTIQMRKNNYCKLAKVKQIRIHDFRHSCASLLINQGASIALVSKYLGHSKISITLNTYTHLYKSELESITNVLNSL